jgi:hypothetical protein
MSKLAFQSGGGILGYSMLSDNNTSTPVRLGAFALGFWGGGQTYGFLMGPGSLPDSIENPFRAVGAGLSGKGTLAQDVTTAGVGYGGFKGSQWAVRKYAGQGGRDATEALEVGANDAVAGTVEAAEVGESASIGAELLAGAETAAEFLPVLLL